MRRAGVAAPRRLRGLRAWAWIGPSLVLAGAVLVYPLQQIVALSLSTVSRFGIVRGWAGAGNYLGLLADPVFAGALVRTAVWTVGVVGGTIALSLPAAMVLRREFAGRGLARTIVMLPWSVSLAMAAMVWLWSFNADYGMINAMLRGWGLMDSPVHWMARAETAFPVEIGVGVLVSIPFTVTILLGGLASIPGDVYEAAALDGARPRQAAWHLTLPLLRPFLTIAVVLNVIHVFNSFPIIWVMTQGGPDNGTHILVTYFYELSFRLGRVGPAAAVSVVMLAIVLCFTVAYLRLRRGEMAA